MPPVLVAAWSAYRSGAPPALAAAAERAVAELPGQGEAWFAAACCWERLGDWLRADRAFARAARCPDEPQDPPYRINWTAFCRLVDEAAASLPERYRAVLGEVTLVRADYAEPVLLEGFDEPELLGLFTGSSRDELPADGALSPCIHLWRRAHEHACASRKEFRQELRTTLFHELGHYLGLDEDEVAERGLG